jgi:hypothetical protein
MDMSFLPFLGALPPSHEGHVHVFFALFRCHWSGCCTGSNPLAPLMTNHRLFLKGKNEQKQKQKSGFLPSKKTEAKPHTLEATRKPSRLASTSSYEEAFKETFKASEH